MKLNLLSNVKQSSGGYLKANSFFTIITFIQILILNK